MIKIYTVITEVLKDKCLKPHQIQAGILNKTGKIYSDSTITRRLREMGCVAIPPADRKQETAWRYKLGVTNVF